jgi:hypothetical protein
MSGTPTTGSRSLEALQQLQVQGLSAVCCVFISFSSSLTILIFYFSLPPYLSSSLLSFYSLFSFLPSFLLLPFPFLSLLSHLPYTPSLSSIPPLFLLFSFQRLLYFLRYPTYSEAEGEKKWKTEIVLPFLAQHDSCRDTLLDLLKSILIRHKKVLYFSFLSVLLWSVLY